MLEPGRPRGAPVRVSNGNLDLCSQRDPNDGARAIRLRGGGLIIPLGSYAELQPEEVQLILNASKYLIEPGIVPPAVNASTNIQFLAIEASGPVKVVAQETEPPTGGEPVLWVQTNPDGSFADVSLI